MIDDPAVIYDSDTKSKNDSPEQMQHINLIKEVDDDWEKSSLEVI